MQIVTDAGADFSSEQLIDLQISVTPLILTLDGKSYRSGIDIQSQQFYALLSQTDSMPTTSQPSAGDFMQLYQQVADADPDILSIHISSGLSGTINAARMASEMVPQAKITVIDTKTLSGAQGWQVEAAARAAKMGWPIEQIIKLVEQVRNATDTMFTLPTLKYLVHGGRVSHIKGFAASLLNIKPIIGVNKEIGNYETRAQARTFNKALLAIADLIKQPKGTAIRAQILHANNEEGAAILRSRLNEMFACTWLPTTSIAPVLGAHTGAGLVGLVYAPLEQFPEMP